jgi:hypothetical protein
MECRDELRPSPDARLALRGDIPGRGNFGGAVRVDAGVTHIGNSVISSNYALYGSVIHQQGGTIVATNSLLYGTIQGAPITNGCLFGLDPLLLPPAENGGPTPTCALQAGSPCIDAANPATAPATDQRGFARDAQPDLGAYEYGAAAPVQSGAVLTLR